MFSRLCESERGRDGLSVLHNDLRADIPIDLQARNPLFSDVFALERVSSTREDKKSRRILHSRVKFMAATMVMMVAAAARSR